MRSAGVPSISFSGLASRAQLPSSFHTVRRNNAFTRKYGLRAEATIAPEVQQNAELSEEKRDIQKMLSKPYKYGFKTIIESDVFPKGLSEDVVRAISAKKNEPEWLLEFRCALCSIAQCIYWLYKAIF